MGTHRQLLRFVLLGAGILWVLLSVAPTPVPTQAASELPAGEKIQLAWRLAQAVGIYHFSTGVDQTIYPTPAISNVGASSRNDQYYLEGDVNLPSQSMYLTLYQNSGNLVNQKDGIEIRVDGNQAFGRPVGGTWQALDQFDGLFAPGSDPMAYLAGATNIQLINDTTRILPYTRYAFEVDGHAFALYVRDQLEKQLREAGELPPGLSLETSSQYEKMTGEGEVWLNNNDLPLRLIVHLEYTDPATGERVVAEINTDFSNYPQSAQTGNINTNPKSWLGLQLTLPRNPQAWRTLIRLGALWLGLAGLAIVVIAFRRLKVVYAGIIGIIIFSMVASPLFESGQVLAFYQRQAEKQQQQADQAAAQAAQDELVASSWDPHLSPMPEDENNTTPVSLLPLTELDIFNNSNQANSGSSDPIDTDLDGITDNVELALGTQTTNDDSDGDTLSDGVEFVHLGTDPLLKDSDGDGIYDNVEVQGFTFDNKKWYLDPNSVDTNNDGRIDTEECPSLVSKTSAGSLTCEDKDGDKTPDIFDLDDDGDGVSDRIDLFVDGIVDRTGRKTNGSTQTAFDDEQPFLLKVESLQSNQPVFVDFQIRPLNPLHLTYALNVLDWPSTDTEGQIQHVKNTTFASSMTEAEKSVSPSASNGDMRLIPMLEITIPGTNVPLARTDPVMDVQWTGDISGTAQLTLSLSNHENTRIEFAFENTSQAYTINLYSGKCGATDSLLSTLTNVVDGNTRTLSGYRTVEIADGDHALTISDGLNIQCSTIANIINGPYPFKMIDQAPLQPYGITVREADAVGTLLAYIPLNLVPDETGGGRVAFSARMVYDISTFATWQQAQEVRVVWLLQMLMDGCDTTNLTPKGDDESDEDFGARAETWCADPANRTADENQIVQTFPESWFLTGMAVREDHGLDTAIIYEDPTNGDLTYNENLWQVARGLSSTLLTGRNCEDSTISNDPDYVPDSGICHMDIYRDISIYNQDQDGNTIGNTNVYDRFDSRGSVDDGDVQRWGITKAALQVERTRYPHQDYSAYQAMMATPSILQNYATDVIPTLLFLREEHYRMADIQAGSMTNGIFTVEMNDASHPLETLAGIKWMPYRYSSEIGPDGQIKGWEPYPISEYWDILEVKYTDFFNQILPDETEASNLGRAVVARSYYLSLVQGIMQKVQNGSTILSQPAPAGEDSDSIISSLVAVGVDGKSFGKKIAVLVKNIAKATYQAYGLHRREIRYGGGTFDIETGVFTEFEYVEINEEFHGFFDSLGSSIKANTIGPWIEMFSGGTKSKIGAGIALVGAVAVVGLTLYGVSQQKSAADAVSIVFLGLSVIMSIQSVVSEAVKIIKAAQTAGSLSAALSKGFSSTASSVKSAFKSAAVVGLIIGVVITWGALATQIGVSYGMGGGMSRIALANAIAGAIAATIVAVILFIVAAIPVVGQIIAAVIALIDAVIALFCNIFLSAEEQAENAAAKWLCGGISGLVTNIFAVLIYSGNVMVELYPEDYTRLEFSNFEADDLVHPDWGIVVGNSIRYGVTITNTIQMGKLPDNLGAAYRYQYNDNVLHKSSFEYGLSITNTVNLHEDMQFETTTDWAYVDGDGPDWGDFGHTWHKAEPIYINRTVRSDEGIPFTEAGINRSIPLYLLEGYVIPSQNCILGICTIWEENGTENYDLGSDIKFDVFPASLDDFYMLSLNNGGYALAWGQADGSTFVRLLDADGDGVPYTTDAHDNNWDNDGDGLSDGYEVRLGTRPDSLDSDSDGLRDDLEILAGSNPLRSDSDGDGLSDGEEVFHQDLLDQDADGNTTEWLGGWLFVYDQDLDGTLLTTRVTSSPHNPNSDGDSLSDYQEFVYGFNPNWASNPNILSFESTISEQDGSGGYSTSDGFVQPGETLYYSATLKNELYNRWAHGLLETDFPGVLPDDNINPQSFLLYPQEEQSLSGEVPVADVAASGVYSLTQTAGALISNWSDLSQGAALWLPFDEDPSANIFADRSGSIPSHDGICSNPISGVGCVPNQIDGVFGGSLILDGASLVASDYDPADSAFAVSLWFKTSNTNGGLFEVRNILDRHLFMKDGKVMAGIKKGSSTEYIQSSSTYNDGKWHHVVFTFGGSAGGQKLYVDGQLAASGSNSYATPNTNSIDFGYASVAGVGYYTGKIDDVRLFEDGLSYSEIQVLFAHPIFDMRFNQNSGWKDDSPFQNNASCSGSVCPTRVDGIDGGAVEFNGTQRLMVPEDDSLNLQQGGFTIGMWIYPTQSPEYCYERDWMNYECEIYRPMPQGIFGYGSGGSQVYPTIQRVGKKLRFTFGSRPYFTTGDVLADYEWNHVVVTFDGTTVKIFVDGVMVGEDATNFVGIQPPNVKTFTIGRSGTQATVDIKKIFVDDEGDGGTDRTGEFCMAYKTGDSQWFTVFNQDVKSGLVDSNGFPYLYDVTEGPFSMFDSGTILFWENDGGQLCVTTTNQNLSTPIDDGDDSMGSWSFNSNQVSQGYDGIKPENYAITEYSGDGSGFFYYVYNNDSIPYLGRIDDLVIYKQAMDDEAVNNLYLQGIVGMHLPFDDAPGSNVFGDESGNQDGTCSAEGCPVVGEAGRLNQSVRFDGNDAIEAQLDVSENAYAASLWFKTDCPDCGLFSSDAGTLAAQGHDRDIFLSNGAICAWVQGASGNELLCTSNQGYDDNLWHQVVHTYGGKPEFWPKLTLKFEDGPISAPAFIAKYYDGQDLSGSPECTLTDTWPISHDWGTGAPNCSAVGENYFSVRWTGDFKFSAGIYTFQYNVDNGMRVWIDDLNIINDWNNRSAFAEDKKIPYYITAGTHTVKVEYKEGVGDAMISFSWTPLFPDSSGNDFTSFCSGNSCPTNVTGKIGRAINFDGVNDYVMTSRDAAIEGLGPVAVSAWVKTTSRTNQVIVHQPYDIGIGWTEYQLMVKADGTVRWMNQRGSTGFDLVSTKTVNDGQWHFVAGVRDDRMGYLYVDGNLEASIYSISGASDFQANWIYIGKDGRYNDKYFKGSIDEVNLYDRALSQGDIQKLFFNNRLYVDGIMVDSGWLNSSSFTSQTGVNLGFAPQAVNDYFTGSMDDLRVYQTGIGQDEVDKLYHAAPILQLHLDEGQQADEFSDDSGLGHNGFCSDQTCPQSGFAIDGQIKTAADFDGIDDYIFVQNHSTLNLNQFSLSAWVLPTQVKSDWQSLITKGDAPRSYGLFIEPNSMTVQFSIQKSDCLTFQYLESDASLMQNIWNHVVATYDGQDMLLYINGRIQGSTHVGSNVCPTSSDIQIGDNHSAAPFTGRIDEVMVYDHALTGWEISSIFDYQGKWVEERQSHSITVDADDPIVMLDTTGIRLPNTDVQMLITSQDTTSGISRVELGVQKIGQSSTSWDDAPVCQDAVGISAWCPTFMPAGEGGYLVMARVTDLVNHQTTVSTTIYVDDHAPVGTFNFLDDARIDAVRSTTEPNLWLLHLSGSVNDPQIGSVSGSGLVSTQVMVSVLDDAGSVIGSIPQRATLNGLNWSVDYQLPKVNASDRYIVQLSAVDKIALRPSLSGEQIAQHTLITTRQVQVDATAASAYLDVASIPVSIIDTLFIQGQVSERAAPIKVSWTTDAAGDEFGFTLVCDAFTLGKVEPGSLPPLDDSYVWEGIAHQASTCSLSVSDSGGDGGVFGSVTVCGEQVADWDASYSNERLVNFTADSTKCGTELAISGISTVDTAFVSILPESPHYQAEIPIGELLHLPFEDASSYNASMVVMDISGQGWNGVCEGTSCPSTGQVGHLDKAMRFDGVANKIQVIQGTDLGPRSHLSASVWIYPMGSVTGTILYKPGEFAMRRTANGTISLAFVNLSPTMNWFNTTYKAPLDQWTHLSFVYDSSSIGLYANGELVYTTPASGPIPNLSDLYVGGYSGKGYFAGMIDELQLFDHALTFQEIRRIYLGHAPVLNLPLDSSWVNHGSSLEDASGWNHHGMMNSGLNDKVNKAVTGATGAFALNFDGVNDFAAIPDDPSLDLQTFSVALWLNPRDWLVNDQVHPLIVKGMADGSQVNYGLYINQKQGYLTFRFDNDACSSMNSFFTQAIPRNQWSHIAALYDGSFADIYLNGQRIVHTATSGAVCQNDEPIRIGQSLGSSYPIYIGALDDVQIFPRPLSAPEIRELYLKGWKNTLTTPNGTGIALADWSTSIPAGLEGAFQLDLRGTDIAGHVSSPETDAWRGEIDTLAPRVTMDAEINGDTVHYSTTAQDFNLTEDGFSSPCGAGFVNERTYYEATWYQALLIGDQRLNQLSVDCERSVVELPGDVGEFDTTGIARGVAVEQTGPITQTQMMAYLADSGGGLQIVDVTNPIKPAGISSLAGGYPMAVVVEPGGPVLQPDLIVDSIVVEPPASTVDQSFVVTVTVTNQDLGDAYNFKVALYQDHTPAACESASIAWTATIPLLASGASTSVAFTHPGLGDMNAHSLYAQSDSGCVISESNEMNNITGPVNVTAVKPDLVLESLAIDPVGLIENQPFTVTVTIKNQGTQEAKGFNTTVYEDIVNPGCGTVGWDTISVPELAPGESLTMTFTHPGFPFSGIHAIVAFVDSICVVTEIDEYNNQLSQQVSINTPPKPDLLITNFLASPSTLQPDQPIMVTVTVKNQGDLSSSGFNTSVFAESLPSVCLDLVGEWDSARTDALAPGASITMTFTHPGFSTIGQHILSAFVDSGCEVIESDEVNNNTFPFYITIVDPNQPDLSVEDIQFEPTSPFVDETFVISFTVANDGQGAATNFDTTYYVDNIPSACDEGAPDWYFIHIDSLPASSSIVVTATLSLSTTGQHEIYAQADGSCSVTESIEDNNIFGPAMLTIQTMGSNPIRSQTVKLASLTPYTVAWHDHPTTRSESSLTQLDVYQPVVASVATDVVTYTYAYLADASLGLRIIDVSDASHPVQVSALSLTGTERDLVIANGIAYVASDFSGLHIIDVNNPGLPIEKSLYPITQRVMGVDVMGDYAYVASSFDGLIIVRIADPTNPQWVSTYDTPGAVVGVKVIGQYAYVADGPNGFIILDVSDPANPQWVGGVPTTYVTFDLTVEGDRAYVANSTDGLLVVDVADPANPRILKSFDTPGYAEDVAHFGSLAYVADNSTGLRIINPTTTVPTASACDVAGHCTTVAMQETTANLVSSALAKDPQADLYYPTFAEPLFVSINNLPELLDSSTSITVTGIATSTLITLEAITVTVDGTLLDVSGWMSGTSHSEWQVGWTPNSDGIHEFQVQVLGSDGSTASEVASVIVDTLPPVITFSPTLYTTAQYHEPRTIEIQGNTTDEAGVAKVEWREPGEIWNLASLETATWRAAWQLPAGELSDNEVFILEARAFDLAGHITEISQNITVDVMPPAWVPFNLSDGSSSLNPGDILPDTAAALTLTWEESADNSGLDHYSVQWTMQVTATGAVQTTQTILPGGILQDTFAVFDGQRVSVQLGIKDGLGNQRWQDFGDVYVDSPQTPDYIVLTSPDGIGDVYRGWMESGCTLLGVDRRITRTWPSDPQKLLATWDNQALRLSWVGGDWNIQGDLFIYLNTESGGSNQAFDPFGGVPAWQVNLPEGLFADYLVWVLDGGNAFLLHWEGDWVLSDVLGGNPDRFSLDNSESSPITDLYLPFTSIGLSYAGSLDLVAFVTEDAVSGSGNPGLQLWATLPNTNPINSSRVVRTSSLFDQGGSIKLTHSYHWDSLSAGICPNGSDQPDLPGAYIDTDVKVGLEADPSGVTFNLVQDGLFWLQDLLLGSPPADVTSQLTFLSADQNPVADAQVITYTLTYQNLGSDTAFDVTAEIDALYTLSLPVGDPSGEHQVVQLGDILAGQSGEVTFLGVIDIARSPESWAVVAVTIYDSAHPETGEPIEWLWAHHAVDREKPVFYGFKQPVLLLGPGSNLLDGYAYDDSGIGSVNIGVEGPLGSQLIVVPDDSPFDGSWETAWDVSGQNGDIYHLSVQAVDSYGQAGDWSPQYTFILDTVPPTITLDISDTQVISGSLLNKLDITLYGDVADDGGLGRVDVCLEGDCTQVSLDLVPGLEIIHAEDIPETPVQIDATTPCYGSEIERSFVITQSFTVGAVELGFVAQHVQRDDIHLTLTSPAGTSIELLTEDGVSGTNFMNVDSWLVDSVPKSYLESYGDDDPFAPFYDAFMRPIQPLQAFREESSLGTWKLRICDLHPDSNDGVYIRSQLVLTPQDTNAKSGTWSQKVQQRVYEPLDYVFQEIAVYAQDVVGNRSTNPARLDVIIDNVSPVITVTQVVSEGILGGSGVVLAGVVTDGGPAVYVSLQVFPPSGDAFSVEASREGDAWYYQLDYANLGEYSIWVVAKDLAGNISTAGPYQFTVKDLTKVYLPLVYNRYDPTPLVYDNDFDDRAGLVWSNPSLETAPNGEIFLGPFTNDVITLNLSDLPQHRAVIINFDLYILRSWDGNRVDSETPISPLVPYSPNYIVGPDIWDFSVEGQVLLHTTFSNWETLGFNQAFPMNYPEGDFPARTGAIANNTLGFIFGTFVQDSTYRLSYTVDHTSSQLLVDFSGASLQTSDDESWGLDNIEIRIIP